jgi:hypothetical protein
LVLAAVQRHHPTASIALVERCVYDAFQALRDVRLRQYLLILIERRASDAVRDAVTQVDETRRDIPGSTVPAAATEISPSAFTDMSVSTDATPCRRPVRRGPSRQGK